MKMQSKRIRIGWAGLLVVAAAVSACGGDQRELQRYIDDIKARPGGTIEPLPEIRPAPSYVYEAGDRRSPFMPDLPQQVVNRGPDSVDRPDPNRARENLERYPLDGLSMVGTLADSRGGYALVQDPDGLVHTVTVGNYLGQNNGRINGISESRIDLTEVVSDGLGGYIERPASIALNNTQ